MTSNYKLHIGSYGWQYQSWQNSFYPDDLPAEWQLAYYANEYSVLMIPGDKITNNIEQLKQGIEDCENSCRFILEIPVYEIQSRSSSDIFKYLQEILSKIIFVGTRCLAIIMVFKYSEIITLTEDKLALIAKLIATCQLTTLTCIDLQVNEYSELSLNLLPKQFLEILNDSKTEICRYNDSIIATSELTNSDIHITFCDISNLEPSKMRKIVENSLIGECEDSTNVLIFRTESPSHEQMKTASVICDLL